MSSQRNSYTTGLFTAVMRGFRRRCPQCGQGKAFKSYFKMKERCDVCGLNSYREEGYWVGAMVINIAACEIGFFLLFLGTLLATSPDIRWTPILVAALVTNGVLPILFYPHSKTVWMGIDHHFHPAGRNEA